MYQKQQALFILIFTLIAIGSVLTGDTPDDKKNTPAGNKTDDDKNEPNVEEEPLICKRCKCRKKINNPEVDCTGLNLTGFSKDDWIALNKSMPDLQIITFNVNAVEKLIAFPLMLNVRELRFHHNNIKEIEDQAFEYLPSLATIDLSWNKLTSQKLRTNIFEGKYSPDDYEPLKYITKLDLSNNDLRRINQDAFVHLAHLEELSLARNPFKIIDIATAEAFKSLVNLKILDLGDMELEDLPDAFMHVPFHLETLNLTENLLKKIPSTLRFADNLRTLILDDNPIEKIGGEFSFPKIPNLEILSISNMPEIKEIGKGAFSNLPNLSTLHCVSNHQLTSIHPEAFSSLHPDTSLTVWPPIKRLYLIHNALTTIDSQLLGSWSDSVVIDLGWNHWACNCSNDWLINTLMPIIQKTTPNKVANVVCDGPTSLVGKQLISLSNTKSFECTGPMQSNGLSFGVGVLVGMIVSVGLVVALFIINKYTNLIPCGSGRPPSAAAYSRQYYSPAQSDQFDI